MDLRSLEKQWLKKWDEMQLIKHPTITLAEPFFSVDTSSVPPKKERKILFVGKATHKAWFPESFKAARHLPPTGRIRERKWACGSFLEDYPQHQRSAFWQFYRALGEHTAAKVIWTNVAKIGVKRPEGEHASINPWGVFLDPQRDLAVRTLLAEIEEYKPALVVLLTGGDSEYKFAGEIFGPWGDWQEDVSNGSSIRYMKRTKAHPAVLLVAHPSFKGNAKLRAWAEKAAELMNPSRQSKTRKP